MNLLRVGLLRYYASLFQPFQPVGQDVGGDGFGGLDQFAVETLAHKEEVTHDQQRLNGCDYCVNAHTAALKGLRLGDAELIEAMAVVDLFNGFNRFLDGMQIESDLKPRPGHHTAPGRSSPATGPTPR